MLGPGSPSTLAVEDRRVAVIDVSDEPLTALLSGQIRDDILAATADPRLTRAHAFSRARLLPYRHDSRAQRSPDPTGCPHFLLSHAADAAVTIEVLRTAPESLGDALADLKRISAAEAEGPAPLTVRDARRQSLVRVLPGNRHGFDLRDDGNVAVIGVPELTSKVARDIRRINRLTSLGTYDAARLTEPGDVVFTTSPPPRRPGGRDGWIGGGVTGARHARRPDSR